MFIVVFVLLYVCFGILPLWRIQGKKNVALGVAACQLLGFPATYLIANEVATAAAENEEEKEYVRQFFEYDKISKCIKRNGIDEEALEKIYDGSIVHFDINPIELNFGFNDIYEKYVKVNTNIDWNVK